MMDVRGRMMNDSATWEWLMSRGGFRHAAHVAVIALGLPTTDGYRRLAGLRVG